MADYLELDDRKFDSLRYYLKDNNATVEEVYFDGQYFAGAKVTINGQTQYVDNYIVPTTQQKWDGLTQAASVHIQTYDPSIIEVEETPRYYKNDRAQDVESLAEGKYYRVDGKIYTKEQFATEFGDSYYQREAYYDQETQDMLTIRHYANGDYGLDEKTGKTIIPQSEFKEKYGGYEQLSNGGRTIFVDKSGRFHQVEYNGNTIIDSTEPEKKIKYSDQDLFENVAQENGWQVYHDNEWKVNRDEEDLGFHSSAGLFLGAELEYATGAEWYAMLKSAYESDGVDSFALVHIMVQSMNENSFSEIKELANKLDEYNSSIVTDITSLADTQFEDLEYNKSIFDNFKTVLVDMNTEIENGQQVIETIKNNLMSIDDEFSNAFEEQYNQALRAYFLSLEQEGDYNHNSLFFSTSMLSLINTAIDRGVLTGSDLELFKDIQANTKYEIDAPAHKKFLAGCGVALLSTMQGALKPLESAADGLITVVASGTDLFGARKLSDSLLKFVGEDWLGKGYDLATANINYNLAHGDLHDLFYTIGEIGGEVFAWNVIPTKWSSLFNAAKTMGEGSQKRLNGDFDYTSDRDRLAFYAFAAKDFAFGYESKELFKKYQKWLVNSPLGKATLSTEGRLPFLASVKGLQGAGNAGIQFTSNLFDVGINAIVYGDYEPQKANQRLLQAYINGVFSPNAAAEKAIGDYNLEVQENFTGYDEVMRGKKININTEKVPFLGSFGGTSSYPDVISLSNEKAIKYGLKFVKTLGGLDISDGTILEPIGNYSNILSKWGLSGGKPL